MLSTISLFNDDDGLGQDRSRSSITSRWLKDDFSNKTNRHFMMLHLYNMWPTYLGIWAEEQQPCIPGEYQLIHFFITAVVVVGCPNH